MHGIESNYTSTTSTETLTLSSLRTSTKEKLLFEIGGSEGRKEHNYHVLDYNSTSFLQWLSKTHLVRFLLQLQ